MADYNSRFTGAEIDAAIEKTGEIGEFAPVYSGSPTNSPLPISSFPVNPSTGDRSGLYYVIQSIDNTSTKTTTTTIYIHDLNEDSHSSSNTAFDQTGGNLWVSASQYKAGAGTVSAAYDRVDLSNPTGGDAQVPLSIHKVYRFQAMQ